MVIIEINGSDCSGDDPTNQNVIRKNRLNYYKNLVKNAINENKTFRITAKGVLIKFKAELLNRGFIEHIVPSKKSVIHRMNINALVEGAHPGNEFEDALIAKLLLDRKPDIVWAPVGHYTVHAKAKLLNRIEFTGTSIITKAGLCQLVKKINAERANNAVVINVPRMYLITNDADAAIFKKDFNWSIVIGLLAFLNDEENLSGWFSTKHYSIQTDGILLAIKLVQAAVYRVAAGILHRDEIDNSYLNGHVWQKIYKTHESLIKMRGRIQGNAQVAHEISCKVKEIMAKVYKFWPHHKYDGYKGVWIVKPATKGRGEGIFVSDDIQKIQRYVNSDEMRYIAQRYIERPLLAYGIKFDLRLYLLIMIDEQYYRGWTCPGGDVKLCSATYTLDSFSTSRHITNTAVQEKYKQTCPYLPDNHMWSMDRLYEYFESIGHANIYQANIYPSIKRTLRQLCEACATEIEMKSGRFELFGLDWIINHDFTPYLLEVNRGPSLQHFTPVSVMANNKLMSDLVKVVIDHNRDANADTGDFEIIYEDDIENIKMHSKRIERERRKSSPDMDYLKILTKAQRG